MQDFNVIIDGIKANTNMIEEDVIRQRLGLEPKEQKGDDNYDENKLANNN